MGDRYSVGAAVKSWKSLYWYVPVPLTMADGATSGTRVSYPPYEDAFIGVPSKMDSAYRSVLLTT